jgi:hypothetical protein
VKESCLAVEVEVLFAVVFFAVVFFAVVFFVAAMSELLFSVVPGCG